MGNLITNLNDFASNDYVNAHLADLTLGLTTWQLTSEVLSPVTLSASASDPYAAMAEADSALISAGYKRVTIWRVGDPYFAVIV